jgi:hypothetical protein
VTKVRTKTPSYPAGLSNADSGAGRMQRAVLDLLREHQAQGDDGLPTSSRFLFYELVQRKVISKKPKGEGKAKIREARPDIPLQEALTYLRKHGIIPWDWITDETRSLSDFTGWSSITEWATTMIEQADLDPWKGHPPLILTESRSLAGVLDRLAQQYRIKLSATNGQAGGFLHTDVGPQLSAGSRVLYAGDWDWQGHQIENNTRTVLEQIVGGDLDWNRIALTEDQVDEYDLRPLMIQKPDRRYKPVRVHDAIETEALRQDVIVGIVRAALDAELPEPMATVLERERRQRAAVRRKLK